MKDYKNDTNLCRRKLPECQLRSVPVYYAYAGLVVEFDNAFYIKTPQQT